MPRLPRTDMVLHLLASLGFISLFEYTVFIAVYEFDKNRVSVAVGLAAVAIAYLIVRASRKQ